MRIGNLCALITCKKVQCLSTITLQATNYAADINLKEYYLLHNLLRMSPVIFSPRPDA